MDESESSGKHPHKGKGAPTDIPLEKICYDMAYFILPRYVFDELARVKHMCLDMPGTANVFFYVFACAHHKIKPDRETAMTFRWHHGKFDEHRDYFVLEYPTPAPLELDIDAPQADPEKIRNAILAPYYSAIIDSDETGPEYFTLGQAPFGGTTVRRVCDDGRNGNLGPGPEPTLDGFLDAIRQRQTGY